MCDLRCEIDSDEDDTVFCGLLTKTEILQYLKQYGLTSDKYAEPMSHLRNQQYLNTDLTDYYVDMFNRLSIGELNITKENSDCDVSFSENDESLNDTLAEMEAFIEQGTEYRILNGTGDKSQLNQQFTTPDVREALKKSTIDGNYTNDSLEISCDSLERLRRNVYESDSSEYSTTEKSEPRNFEDTKSSSDSVSKTDEKSEQLHSKINNETESDMELSKLFSCLKGNSLSDGKDEFSIENLNSKNISETESDGLSFLKGNFEKSDFSIDDLYSKIKAKTESSKEKLLENNFPSENNYEKIDFSVQNINIVSESEKLSENSLLSEKNYFESDSKTESGKIFVSSENEDFSSKNKSLSESYQETSVNSSKKNSLENFSDCSSEKLSHILHNDSPNLSLESFSIETPEYFDNKYCVAKKMYETLELTKNILIEKRDNVKNTPKKEIFKQPTLSQKMKLNYNYVKSPISRYIQESPTVPLVKKIVQKAFVCVEIDVNKKKTPSKNFSPLPIKSYHPIRNVKLSQTPKENQLPKNVEKYLTKPLRPEIIKHTGRIGSGAGEKYSRFVDGSVDLSVFDSSKIAETSVMISSEAKKTYTLKRKL